LERRLRPKRGDVADIFLSYAREDAERVREFADELTRLGWAVWWDDRLRTAAEFDEVIERELDAASCVVVVWSRSSIASGWVRAEASAANQQGKLVPVRFESDVLPPLRFRQLNTATLQTWHLSPPTGDTLRLLAEITRLSGQRPAGIDVSLLDLEVGGARSGAEIVTAGKWRLTTRFLGARGTYNINLYPNGLVSGNGAWLISRGDFAGRWFYDAAEQVLQLETSGGVSDGIEVLRIEITRWIDNDTADCRFQSRKARLERVGG
jgi:hypothetical protein